MTQKTSFIKDVFRGYVSRSDRKDADRKLPSLMVEGLLLGGTGLGVLALIFEIAADAFSVAAYQTLLAIHGAAGHHEIAFAAFTILSIMLFFGVVPAYKAGAYLRPNAGGSGPLVEAIGPPRIRFLSWIGSSLFFLDAILTIIISAVSAADVMMLLFPEWASYRMLLAEGFAFFIMVVLVAVGPRRAVPLFLIGGGAFTLFTVIALSVVGGSALLHPEWGELTSGIVHGLEDAGVVSHVVRVTEDASALSQVLLFQLLLRSMSSAMLGFSGYEVIPASGKHAARPKWKVINTALVLAAVFLILTGMIQLVAAWIWRIPATEGYSTLLIEYEIVASQIFNDPAIGTAILSSAGMLLATILLLAQGGGYVGGAAVAANAARLGRLPRMFQDDRIGIVVIWGFASVMIPIIREVVIVEAYYAFGFVSAFIITSTTIFFVREDALMARGIEPGSGEARSLKFAGLRGMIASYLMGIVLVTQKTSALLPIVIIGGLITLFQIWYYRGGFADSPEKHVPYDYSQEETRPIRERYISGGQRAHDEARQRGVADRVNEMIAANELVKFNVDPRRIRRLITYTHTISEEYWTRLEHHHEHIPEPSMDLEATFQEAYDDTEGILGCIEHYSHYGIFTFVQKYHLNWVNERRDKDAVERAMLKVLFPRTPLGVIWDQYDQYEWVKIPEDVWQFCRRRYQWAKDQWPNFSDSITTLWTLQDLGMLEDVDAESVVDDLVARLNSVNPAAQFDDIGR